MVSRYWTLDGASEWACRRLGRPGRARAAAWAALGLLGPAAPTAAQVPPSPPPAGSFEAVLKQDTFSFPDASGAVGEDRVIASVNARLRVQDKAGNPIGAVQPFSTFWGSSTVWHSRIVYCPDPVTPDNSMWVHVAVDTANRTPLIAVFKGRFPDPGTNWGSWRKSVQPDAGFVADFVNVGFNRHWVALLISSDAASQSRLYVFDRVQLRDQPGGTWSPLSSLNLMSVEGLSLAAESPAPALTYDPSEPDLYLVRVKDRSTGRVRLLKITSPSAPASPVLQSVGEASLPQGGWMLDIPIGQEAQQLQTGTITWRVETRDDRVQNVVVDESGDIWATNTVFLDTNNPPILVGPRAAVQWWAVRNDGFLLRSGRIDDPSGQRFFAYPQIAVNATRDALVSYSTFAPTERVGGSYSRLARRSDGSYVQEGERLLKAGSELADYGICSPTCVASWGRYNTAVRDVAGPDLFALQEVPVRHAAFPFRRWDTWWSRIDPRPWVTVSDASVSEPPDNLSPPNQARFKVALSWPSSQPVQVSVITNDGGATAPGDYGGISSTPLVFAPGETQKTVDVPVYWDGTCEPSETFSLVLSSPVNAWLGETHAASLTATGTIVNHPAPPTITIHDARVLEQSGGGTWNLGLNVTASAEPCLTITVNYATRDGSANSPGDYQTRTGSVTFGVAQPLARTINVPIVKDDTFESEDTQFYLDLTLSGPPAATLLRSSGVVTILDDDESGPYGRVSFLTVTSDSGGTGPPGRARLRWRNPVRSTPQHIHVRWDDTGACPPPGGSPCLGSCHDSVASIATNGSPEMGGFNHGGLPATTHCYGVFAGDPSGSTAGSAGPTTTGRAYPGDGTGAVRWRLEANGGSSLGSPSIGKDSVLALLGSELHAVVRDPALPDAGIWPPGWHPVKLGSMVDQLRFPVLPVADRWRAFIATPTDVGRVYSVDAETGAVLWSRDLTVGPWNAESGAPAAGYFRQFGGSRDLLFVGTRKTLISNWLVALDPFTGTPVPPAFSLAGTTGLITTAPIVDYATRRVFFTSWDNSPTNPNLFCLQIGDGAAPFAGPVWQITVPTDTDGPPATTRQRLTTSPILRNGRIYVGDETGVVYSLRASDGGDIRRYDTGSNASVLGFVFPDRSSDALYLTTGNKVYKVVDNDVVGLAATLEPGWPISIDPTATMPLFFRRQALPGFAWTASGGPGGTKVFRVESGSALEVADLKVNVAPSQPTLDSAKATLYLGTAGGSLFAVSVTVP